MISERDLHRLDFNLLTLMKVLGEECNTRKTAERMCMTQSAVSKGLKKAREQFNDELFARTRHGLVPTENCAQLLKQIPMILEMLSGLYEGSHTVIDDNFTGTISIAINPSLSIPFAPLIANHINKIAPRATLELINWQWQAEQDLVDKKIHLGISYYPLDLPSEIHQQPCGSANFKLCLNKSHPLVQQEVTLEALAQYPIVAVIMPSYSNHKNYIERILVRHGLVPNVILKSDQIHICFDMLQNSHAIMPVNEFMQYGLPGSLTLIDTPEVEDIPDNKIGLYYAGSAKSSGLTRFLVKEVNELLKQY